jgi:uncharacterized protein with PIN domain
MKRRKHNQKQRKIDNSVLVKCDRCGQKFWPGSLEERINVTTCSGCRRERDVKEEILPDRG